MADTLDILLTTFGNLLDNFMALISNTLSCQPVHAAEFTRLTERDYVTFGSLLSQIRLSSERSCALLMG